jgi:circadian clock protein KaiC
MAGIYRTGIPGLDELMLGGFLDGRSVMIEGYTGTGKTVLGMSLIEAGIRELGEPGVIVTFEQPPSAIYDDASTLGWDFRELERQNKLRVIFISPATLLDELAAQVGRVTELIAEIDARRLYVDGVNMFATVERDQFLRRQLLVKLIAAFHREGLNVIFSRERAESDPLGLAPESYLADTVIQLSHVQQHRRRIRCLEVVKSRGQEVLTGQHTFKIGRDGIAIYPRQKMPALQPRPMTYGEPRAAFGVPLLDEALRGGLFQRSATLIAGSSGTGKSTLAMQFLIHGARLGEPGLFVSLEEPAEQVIENARGVAPDVEELLRAGTLRVLRLSPLEMDVNEQIVRVRESLVDGRTKRLAFDSLSNYEDLLTDVEYRDYVFALLSFVKSRDVTALFTSEIRELIGVERITTYGTSYLLDNVILLRFVELANTLRRAIVVMKTRGSDHANDIREYVITEEGVQVLPIPPDVTVPILAMQQYSNLLTGSMAAQQTGKKRGGGRRSGAK